MKHIGINDFMFYHYPTAIVTSPDGKHGIIPVVIVNEKDEIMIVGDSLTSDIRGGNNAGILTCWYNPTKIENTKGVDVNFAITNLWEIEQIIQKSETPLQKECL